MADKNFWQNLGDAIKYARSTSTLDGGGAYYVTSQAKEDLREQGKEDEIRQIENAEALGTIGGAALGSAAVSIPAVVETVKWGVTSPIGKQATKNFIANTLLGTYGSELANRVSTKLTGTTFGGNFEKMTDKIPYIKTIPGGVRNFMGELFNVGSFLGGTFVTNLGQRINNSINRGLSNRAEYIKQLDDAIANQQDIKDKVIDFTKKIKDDGAFEIYYTGDKAFPVAMYPSNLTDDASKIIEFDVPDDIRSMVNKTSVVQPRKGVSGFFQDAMDYGLSNMLVSNAHNVEGNMIQFNPLNPTLAFISGVKGRMLKPRTLQGVLGHELQHSVQRLHDVPLAKSSANYYKAVDDKLISYFGKPTILGRTSWHQSPKEFDAEVMKWRITHNNFTPVQQMDDASYESLRAFLQNRFWSNGQIRHVNHTLENIKLLLQADLLKPKSIQLNNRSLYDVQNTDNAANEVLQYLSSKGYFQNGGSINSPETSGKFSKIRDYVTYKNKYK